MNHENDCSPPCAGSSPAPPRAASLKPHHGESRLPIVTFLCFLAFIGTAAAPSASPQASPPQVTTFRVYRAIDSRLLGGSLGNAGTRLGNTDAGSAGGVLGYLHTEVIPSFVVASAGGRLNAIDAIAVFEVRVLNGETARLFPRYSPPGNVKLFGPFLAFNRGKAMPPSAQDEIIRYVA